MLCDQGLNVMRYVGPSITDWLNPADVGVLWLQVMLYTIFPAIALGAGLMWLRLRQLDRLSKSLLNSFNICKAAVLANTMDEQARTSLSVVSLMGDLKRVYRFKDVRQVS